MTKMHDSPNAAAQLILKHAELVASQVARAEVIVDHAIGAAAMVMAAKGGTDNAELAESAKEVLQVARSAATEVLRVAKNEAELTLRLAKSLAISRIAEEDEQLQVTATQVALRKPDVRK